MKRITVLLALLGIFETLFAQTNIPGTIGGSVDVSPSGAASYSLPIQVSPGSHGMQPNLSIVYSSQGGNGLLGWGCNLTGISSISRTNKVAYYNGSFDPITLTDNDAMAMDGVSLVKTVINTYYPANNPYTKVEFNGNTFTVTTQDGMVIEYGGTTDSRILVGIPPATATLTWSISKITDPNGNFIQYVYSNDNLAGEYMISEIKYTGNSITNKAPYNSIKFSYEMRNDATSMFVAGRLVTHSLLLTDIQVFCEGVLSKNYQFEYLNNPYSELIPPTLQEFLQYSKLIKISLTADGVTYTPTTFDWGANANYSTQISDLQVNSLRENQLCSGDFNGDGLVDLAKFDRLNTLSISFALPGGGYSSFSSLSLLRSYNTGSGMVTVSKVDSFLDIKVADINSDGTDEILVHFTFTNSVTK